METKVSFLKAGIFLTGQMLKVSYYIVISVITLLIIIILVMCSSQYFQHHCWTSWPRPHLSSWEFICHMKTKFLKWYEAGLWQIHQFLFVLVFIGLFIIFRYEDNFVYLSGRCFDISIHHVLFWIVSKFCFWYWAN